MHSVLSVCICVTSARCKCGVDRVDHLQLALVAWYSARGAGALALPTWQPDKQTDTALAHIRTDHSAYGHPTAHIIVINCTLHVNIKVNIL